MMTRICSGCGMESMTRREKEREKVAGILLEFGGMKGI